MEGNEAIKQPWYRNEEGIYSFFCFAIIAGLIFWSMVATFASLAFGVYWLLFSKKTFSLKESRGRLVLLFSALYVIMLVSVLYSANRDLAVHKLIQKTPLFLFPLVFGTAVITSPLLLKRSLRVLTWTCFAGCIYCLGAGLNLYLETGSYEQLHGYEMIVLKDMSAFIFGLCCMLCLLFIIIRRMNRERPVLITGWLDVVGACFFFLFLILLSNRNVLLFLTGALVYLSLRAVNQWKKRIILLVSLLALLAVAIRYIPSLSRQWKDLADFSSANTIPLDQDSSLGKSWGGKSIRIALWLCAADVIERHPLTGVGVGDVQDSLQQSYEDRKFYFASRYNKYNAHNQYVQEAVSTGLIGCSLLLAGILVPLLLFRRKRQHLLYHLFLLSFAFICITESILELSKGLMWYSFFNAIFVFSHYIKSPQHAHGNIQKKD